MLANNFTNLEDRHRAMIIILRARALLLWHALIVLLTADVDDDATVRHSCGSLMHLQRRFHSLSSFNSEKVSLQINSILPVEIKLLIN